MKKIVETSISKTNVPTCPFYNIYTLIIIIYLVQVENILSVVRVTLLFLNEHEISLVQRFITWSQTKDAK